MSNKDLPLNSLLQELTNLDIDVQNLEENELLAHRAQISKMITQCKLLMKDTAEPKESVDIEVVQKYIKEVLDLGFECKEIKQHEYPELQDLQHSNAFADLIKAQVQISPFSSKTFKVKHLSYQRSDIEKSKTLHQLRQSMKAIKSSLEFYREQQEAKDSIAWLTEEYNNLSKALEEKERMLNEIMGLYEDSYDDITLYRNICNAKQTLSLSDVDVLKVFNISKHKLQSLRENVQIQGANLASKIEEQD